MGQGYGWEPVLADDFDDGTLDEDVWQVHDRNYFGDATPAAVEESGGNLTLRTYTDGDGNHTGRVTSGDHAVPLPGGFQMAYGYVEARIRLDTKPGVRPRCSCSTGTRQTATPSWTT